MLTETPFIQKLVGIASSEFDRFHEVDESDEPLKSRILLYCNEIGIGRPAKIKDFPWSATFVSWCVKTAGATSSEFVFSPAHAVFVKAAIANADKNVGVFRARPIADYKPKVGDIIHRNRGGGSISYKQARSRANYISHSAIVVEIKDIKGVKVAITIGGNEGNSIRKQRVRLTPDGHVMQMESNPYICVIEDLKVKEAHVEHAPVEAMTPEVAIDTSAHSSTDMEKRISFIDDKSLEKPSFHDIGSQSPIDDPKKMLRGIRAFRTNVDPKVSVEMAVGRDTSLPSVFLEMMSSQRRAVGKISTSGVNFEGDRSSWMGTGFLVGKNILLTNHHVLNSAEVAARATVDFGYEVPAADLVMGDLEPKGPSARTYRLDPSKLFITSPLSNTNKGLDYTFVWIEDEAEATFGSIAMNRGSFSVAEGERAFIVHHPNGHGRRISLDENNVLRMTTSALHYTTDTERGSSGSPVFDCQARLIALHHASVEASVQLPNGETANVLNEGIKISAIVADLEARGSDAERPMVQKVLEVVKGSDTMSGFFGGLGRAKNIASNVPGVERVVDVYKGSDSDIDIGFWNIEWLANRYDDPEKLSLAAFLIVDLGLDIWGLEEVSPPAVRALVDELEERFGERYSYALSEPDAGENKQSTAVIWKEKTVNGSREEWPEDIERLWHMRSTDDLGLEAVEGKIFDRYPGLFRFSMKRKDAPFEFYVVPLHLKAMAEGSKRRRLASRVLAHAVKTMTEKYNKSKDWVIGGDLNASLSSKDFKLLLASDFVPMSAEDEQAGAFTYVKSPKSLIDHIFLSPNLAQKAGPDSYFIVAKDKSIDKYDRKLSDHRPVLVRISLGKRDEDRHEVIEAVDEEIERVLEGRDAVIGDMEFAG